MTDDDWGTHYAKSLMVWLNGEGIPTPGAQGERITDDDMLLLFNGHYEPLAFVIPEVRFGREYRVAFDTATADEVNDPRRLKAGEEIELEARALAVLISVDAG
jgi:glycogen operon protein